MITVWLSITANWSGWWTTSAAQLGFSGFLWVAQPLGEPEALIEKELGYEWLKPGAEGLACSNGRL